MRWRAGKSTSPWLCSSDGHEFGTGQVVLRTIRVGDLDSIVATVDGEVLRWQGFPSAPEALREFVRGRLNHGFQAQPYIEHFAITDRETGTVIGIRSLYGDPRGTGLVQTGSWLGEGWRGQGLGIEELREVISYAKSHQHVTKILAGTEVSNEPALRQYQAAGFREAWRRDHTLPDARVVPAVWLALKLSGRPRAAMCEMRQPPRP